jgi:CRISPR/Cas system-associated endonuclease Cas1
LIDQYLEKISELKRNVTIREDLARDAEARSFSLPPADATDKLLRYEAHLDRQLYRAMDQLERLQRQRRGENVPPPLNINLGRRR